MSRTPSLRHGFALGGEPLIASRSISYAAGGLLVGFVLFPFLLLGVGTIIGVHLATLAQVGQIYAGSAGLISAVALIAVALSVRIQAQQTKTAQMQAVRDMQLQLMKIAMENADYAATFSPDSGRTEWQFQTFRKETYTNLVFQYLQFSYLIGVSSEPALRRALRQELFANSAGREFWDAVRTVLLRGS